MVILCLCDGTAMNWQLVPGERPSRCQAIHWRPVLTSWQGCSLTSLTSPFNRKMQSPPTWNLLAIDYLLLSSLCPKSLLSPPSMTNPLSPSPVIMKEKERKGLYYPTPVTAFRQTWIAISTLTGQTHPQRMLFPLDFTQHSLTWATKHVCKVALCGLQLHLQLHNPSKAGSLTHQPRTFHLTVLMDYGLSYQQTIKCHSSESDISDSPKHRRAQPGSLHSVNSGLHSHPLFQHKPTTDMRSNIWLGSVWATTWS